MTGTTLLDMTRVASSAGNSFVFSGFLLVLRAERSRGQFYPGVLQGCLTPEFGGHEPFRQPPNAEFTVEYLLFLAAMQWKELHSCNKAGLPQHNASQTELITVTSKAGGKSVNTGGWRVISGGGWWSRRDG